MALPLPKILYDVEPGGRWVTSAKGANSLTRSELENEAKRIENEYLPLKTKAQAASQLAYSNLAGPQFVAKLFGNEHILPSIPENQKKAGIQGLIQAGMSPQNANGIFNSLSNSSNTSSAPSNPLSHGLLGILYDKLLNNSNNKEQQPNQLEAQQPMQQSAPANISNGPHGALTPQGPAGQQFGEVNRSSPEEVSYYANNGNSVPYNQGNSANAANQDNKQPTVAENEATYKGIVKQGEAEGTERGKAVAEIGKEQLALNSSGVILDRLTNIVQNPTFNSMREKIPFFQDKQLSYLSKTGTKEEQKLIGDFISTAQAFKASTVNSFKGKALEKEFNLADKIKIDENDTMGVAQGKLQSLKTLKEIAETKNDIVLDLMSGPKHMNLGKAIKEANKMIDIKSIEKEVDSLLNPKVTIMYKNNQKYHIPNNRIEAAKKAGYTNG